MQSQNKAKNAIDNIDEKKMNIVFSSSLSYKWLIVISCVPNYDV